MMPRPGKSKETVTSTDELLSRFDKAHFFTYVEGYVLKSLSQSGTFEPGKTEWFIVDYFDRHVFNWQSFVYVPEFADAIFEFLHKHQDKLVSFVTTNSRMKDAMFPKEAQRKYLTLVHPEFDESSRGLLRSMLDAEVAQRRRMNQFKNKLKRRLGKLRRKK